MIVQMNGDCLILTPTLSLKEDDEWMLATICYKLGRAKVRKDFSVSPDGSVTILVGDLRTPAEVPR